MSEITVRQIFFDPNTMVLTFINGVILSVVLNFVLFYFSYWEYQLGVFIGAIVIFAPFDMWWILVQLPDSAAMDQGVEFNLL